MNRSQAGTGCIKPFSKAKIGAAKVPAATGAIRKNCTKTATVTKAAKYKHGNGLAD